MSNNKDNNPASELQQKLLWCREATARRIFDIEHIYGSMKEAAQMGYGFYCVPQEQEFDLVHTKAGQALISQLLEDGFKVTLVQAEKSISGVLKACYPLLVIYWHDFDDRMTLREEKIHNRLQVRCGKDQEVHPFAHIKAFVTRKELLEEDKENGPNIKL